MRSMGHRKAAARRWRRRHLSQGAESLERRQLLAADGWWNEAVINDPVSGNQSTASAGQSTALFADGTGIVAYSGRGEGDRRGVFVRRADELGSPTGAPIAVNQTRSATQSNAVVAAFDDGSALVAWSGRGKGDPFGIFARRVSADDQLASQEIKINQTTRGIQSQPVLATLADGSFVVGWAGTGRGDVAGVFVRRFDASGNPLGGEIRVNASSAGIQGSPQLIATDDGFAVAYSGASRSDAAGVFIRRYDRSGTPISAETRINQTTVGVQGSPDIASLGNDRLLVVWSGRGNGDPSGIYARTINSRDEFSGDEIRVNETTSGLQFGPRLATADDGSFLVLWNEFGAHGFDTAVKGRHFASLGAPAGNEFTLPETQSGHQYAPSLEGDGAGGYFASWTRHWHWQQDVYARRLPPAKTPDIDPPLVSLWLQRDTGQTNSDMLTSDASIAGSVTDASAIASLTLEVTGNQSWQIDVTASYDPSSRTFAVSDAELRGLLPAPLVDGEIVLSLWATDAAGNSSSPVPLKFTLDTTAPQLPEAQLAAESDGAVIGDSRTDSRFVDVTGTAEPGSTIRWLAGGQQTTVDDSGAYHLTSLTLFPGEATYDLQVQDSAGNSATGIITLFFETGASLSESTFTAETVINLPMPPTAVSPTLRFDIGASFDTTAQGFASEDVLGISIVDAADPSRVLLTRADGNESLLSISGNDVDFDPGLVRFDGQSVEIDLSALTGTDQLGLLARWINSDTDLGSTAQLNRIAIDEEDDARGNPTFGSRAARVDPGPTVNLDEYSVDASLAGLVDNVWIEAATGLYRATIRVATSDSATGRRLVVTLPGLPDGIEVLQRLGSSSQRPTLPQHRTGHCFRRTGSGFRIGRSQLGDQQPVGIAAELTTAGLLGRRERGTGGQRPGAAVGDRRRLSRGGLLRGRCRR